MAAKSLRPALSVGLVLAAGLALAGCGRGASAPRPPERGDRAAATVDGQTIWASDVKREAAAQGVVGEGEPLEPGSQPFQQVLDEMIDQKLLAAEAVRRKLDEDPVAQRRLGAAQVAIVRKLLASGAAFETVAMEKSADAETRFNGGDLGYLTADVMPEGFAAALRTAKAGQVVGPVPVQGGLALLKVEDRRPEPPVSFEAARPQIVRFLTYDQIRELLEKLRGRAKIVRLEKADAASQPVPPADAPRSEAGPAPQSNSSTGGRR